MLASHKKLQQENKNLLKRAKLIKGKPDSSRAGMLGPVGKALYDVPGVASVEVDRYSVVVERSGLPQPSFLSKWRDIGSTNIHRVFYQS